MKERAARVDVSWSQQAQHFVLRMRPIMVGNNLASSLVASAVVGLVTIVLVSRLSLPTGVVAGVVVAIGLGSIAFSTRPAPTEYRFDRKSGMVTLNGEPLCALDQVGHLALATVEPESSGAETGPRASLTVRYTDPAGEDWEQTIATVGVDGRAELWKASQALGRFIDVPVHT